LLNITNHILQMKKALCTLLAFSLPFAAFSQSLPAIDAVPLKTAENYRAAESTVLQTSAYLLANPIDKNDETRLKAGVFLYRWVAGTPDFYLSPDENVTRCFEKDVDLITLYYACTTSFAIQYPSVKNSKAITLNAVKTFLNYVNNSNNHVIITRRLKKLSDAAQNGQLENFLKF
jgi:hypothetical protein